MKDAVFGELIERINTGSRGCFGIFRDEHSKRIILSTERRWFLVADISVHLNAGAEKIILTLENWSENTVLALDGREKTPERERICIVTPEKTICADSEEICGRITLVACTKNDGRGLGIDAIFAVQRGQQKASIQWDTTPEMLYHWSLSTRLEE